MKINLSNILTTSFATVFLLDSDLLPHQLIVIPITIIILLFGEILPKGNYLLVNDILNKEEEELSAKKGDKVVAYDDEAPVDTVLGVEIFPVVHVKTQEKIYVSLEDIKDEN